MNKVIRSFIISEFFFWSAWNAVVPIFTVFVIKAYPGSNIAYGTAAYSCHLVFRIFTELLIGRRLSSVSDTMRIFLTITGIVITSIAYVGFAFYGAMIMLFVLYAIAGVGFGIASPAKYSLFSMHLDKKKEAYEWSIYDVVSLGGTAASSLACGFIIHIFGFQTLFAAAALFNFIGALPFILLLDSSHVSE